MALNVGELEAVLRLKDEFSTRLAKAEAQLDSLNKSIDGPNKSFAGMASTIATVGRALGVVVSAGALVQLGVQITDDAARAQDLAEQLQVNVEWLLRVGAAAKAGGGSIADAGTSITFMQKALAGGDAGVVQALADMNLSLDQLQASDPQTAFMAIVTAAQQIPSPIRQTDAALALLGRNGVVFLSAIRKGFEDVTQAATVMPTAATAALDQLSKGLEAAGTKSKQILGEMIAGWVLLYDKITGTDPFAAQLGSMAMAGEGWRQYDGTIRQSAKLTEESLSLIRKATTELEVVFASAAKDGFTAAKAAAEMRHEMELKDIEASVLSASDRTARLLLEEKRYSTELYKIKTDSARAVRDLQEQVGLVMVQRQGQLLQAQLALELSQAALSRGTAESIAAAKAAITVKYAGDEYNAKVRSLDALEQLEAIRADREIADAKDKAAALLAIHEDYEQQRQLLAIQSATELNNQVEQLEAAHIARMAALGSTSTAWTAPSNLSPAEQAATIQHNAALGGLQGAQKQALALGDTEQAQRLQQLIDEEMNIFVAAMHEAGAATNTLTPAVAGATTAMGGAQSAATQMATALQLTTAALNRPKAGDSVAPWPTSGNVVLDTSGAHGFHSKISDPIGALTPYANGGPVPSDGPIFAHAGEIVVPRNGMLVSEGGGGSTTVSVSMAGVLLSSDPMARMALEEAVSAAVMDALKATRKLGNN